MRLALALGAALAAIATHAAAQPRDDALRELEDASRPQTQAFFKEEGARARATLDRIRGRGALLERIRALSESSVEIASIAATGTSRLFYLKRSPGQPFPVLCMRDKLGGPERMLVDPARLAGGAASIDWFVPSPDGRHVAYGVSAAGSEDSVLRVMDADAGRDLAIEIDRARFSGDLAWHPDGRSFFYARIPEASAGAKRFANVRVYRHVLGRPKEQDEIVFAPGVGGARDVPEFVRPSIYIPPESRFAYAIARDGAQRELAIHVTDLRDLTAGKPHWQKMASPEDEVIQIAGSGDDLYLLSHQRAPRRRVLRLKAGAKDMKSARVAVPEGDSVIRTVAIARDAIYLRTMVAGIDRLERVAIGLLGGTKAPEYVRTPFDTSISQLVANPRLPGVLLRIQGWIEPPAVVQIDARGDIRDTQLQSPAAADFGEMDEVRLYAPAADGAKIPVTLMYKKSTTLTRENPTLLEAYGSYGASLTPTFDATRLAWLERGGILAVAHVRGGGEYGEVWHESGRGPLKVNTINDLVAVSEFLVKYGFTNPRRLAIMGAGAGAIAVGGALVRRPDLYAAVVARAPLMDMLRFEAMPGGASEIPEFGTAATPTGLELLRMISALHYVKEGTAYPATLLMTGMNDARVAPWQAAKMAAALQSASTSGKPVLLRVDSQAGHGSGETRAQRDEELADIYSFLLWQMGDPAFQPPGAAPAPPAASAEPASSQPTPAVSPTEPSSPPPAEAPAPSTVSQPPLQLPPSIFAPKPGTPPPPNPEPTSK